MKAIDSRSDHGRTSSLNCALYSLRNLLVLNLWFKFHFNGFWFANLLPKLFIPQVLTRLSGQQLHSLLLAIHVTTRRLFKFNDTKSVLLVHSFGSSFKLALNLGYGRVCAKTHNPMRIICWVFTSISVTLYHYVSLYSSSVLCLLSTVQSEFRFRPSHHRHKNKVSITEDPFE